MENPAISAVLAWLASNFWTVLKIIAIAGVATVVGYGVYRYITVMHAPPVEQTFIAMSQLLPVVINFMIISMIFQFFSLIKEFIRPKKE